MPSKNSHGTSRSVVNPGEGVDGNLLIRNSTMIVGGSIVEGDLRVVGGKIAAIASGGGLDALEGEIVLSLIHI